MTFQPSYTDDELRAAVASQHSWRGVLRALGLKATSAGASRTARRHADRLCLDYSHFTGQRRWSEADLAKAIRECRSWTQVAAALGIEGGSSYPALRGHALRLGLDSSHFGVPDRPDGAWTLVPDQRHLRCAGSLMAAAWYAMCGYEVSWPLGPYRYDLLVCSAQRTQRVQVKTTTRRMRGSWVVDLGPGGKGRVYDPDDIDSFFIVTADLDYYFIPIEAVAGLSTALLSAYADYLIDRSSLSTTGEQVASAS
jgi:hypothetical protein